MKWNTLNPKARQLVKKKKTQKTISNRYCTRIQISGIKWHVHSLGRFLEIKDWEHYFLICLEAT